MPSERRSVGEMLIDSDLLARELLVASAADSAAGLVRTWPSLVQAATRVWAALPANLVPSAEVDPMTRLAGIGAGIGRGTARASWPGPGPQDGRLLEIGANLARAAFLVERYGRDVQPTTAAARADLAAAQARIVHVLYVSTHATTLAVRLQLDQQHHKMRRHKSSPGRPRPADLRALGTLVDRLTTFEDVAGQYVRAHPVAVAGLGQARAQRAPGRLSTVLTRWDAQVHRTFGSAIELPDLIRVARVNAMVAAATGALADTALDRGAVDAPAAGRLRGATGTLEALWTQVAELVGNYVSVDLRTDPLLVRAAAETRAAVRDVACAPIGVKRPDDLPDLDRLRGTVQTLQQSLASSIDVAHLVSDLANDPAGLTIASRRPGTLVGEAALLVQPRVGGEGEQRGFVAPGPTASGRRPLPAVARDHINTLIPAVVTASRQAAAVHLEPESTQTDTRTPQPRRSRQRAVQATTRRAQAPSTPCR